MLPNTFKKTDSISKIMLTRKEYDPYDGGWRSYTPILIDIEDKLDVDKKMSIVIDNISDLWSIQENDLDIDYLRLFFLFNYTYSQILFDERDFKNDSGVWLNIKDYIWIRKVVE